jgi:two-component system cell cycle response regulator CtrA
MTRDATHTTSDVVTVFARQGIALSTIARAMALPVERVEGMCVRARENDELQIMPPATPDDPRHSLLSELTNLRAELDDAQATIRDMRDANKEACETFLGVAGLTKQEAIVVATIVKYGRASKAAIYHALYGGMGEEETRDPKICDVFVCKIRKKFRREGIAIKTHWGFGWSMDVENATRLRALAREAHLDTIPVRRVLAAA